QDCGDAAEVRAGLFAGEPLRARLHLDRADRIDGDGGLRLHLIDEELLGEPRFLVRHLCGSDDTDRLRAAHGGGDGLERLAPGRDSEIVVLPDLRNDDAIGVVLLVREAAVITQPVIVDFGIDARAIAVDLAAAAADEDVAADIAAIADRFRGIEIPDARFEAEFARRQCAGGADVGDAGGHPVVERDAGEDADFRRGAALEESELARAGDLLREADASRAVDAAIHVLHDMRADRRAIHAGIRALHFAVARLHR